MLGKPSHAEYVVCTKALENTKPNAVVGFSLLQSPSGLVLFLSSGQVVTLNTITNPTYLRITNQALKSKDETDNALIKSQINSKVFSGSFEESIRQILASGASQPILKLNTKEVSPKESIKLLIDAFQSLREQYFGKHDKVRQKIENRVKILNVLEEQQRQEVAELMAEKEKIRDNAERLAERYEEMNDRQQGLLNTLHGLLRVVNTRTPGAGAADRNFCDQINKISAATKELAQNISLAKKKMEKQEQHQTTNNTKSVILPPKKETALKEILTETHENIQARIKDIQLIKKTLQME